MENQLVQNANTYPQDLTTFENAMLSFLHKCNLPAEGIFTDVRERIRIFQNIDTVLYLLDKELCQKSVYLSKFLAAGAAGLFDASLNYLWDETVLQLRLRVAQFDLEYFYDNAVGGDKRQQFSTQDDLVKLQDSELINGARKIELISEVGYQHLVYISYMRNWASAAHPNQVQITGLQLVSWLETCIKEVISLPVPSGVVRIKKLLGNIRKNRLSVDEAKEIGQTFVELTQEQASSLGQAFFGIYTKVDTDEPTRQNVRYLLPFIWPLIDEDTKVSFGIKYGYFAANNEAKSKQYSKEFLESVNGNAYIPDSIREVHIQRAITNLLNAHRGFNNFYNEVPWAKHQRSEVGTPISIPQKINKIYVLAVVEVFLTNGNGISWDAEPVYKDLISNFDVTQATIAMATLNTSNVKNYVGFSQLCLNKYLELLKLVRDKMTNPTTLALLDNILKYKSSVKSLLSDAKIMADLKNYEHLVK